MEVLAKDQFRDSLPEEDMRLLRAVLATILELESYQLVSKQKASRKQAESKVCKGDSAGEGAAGAVRHYL